MIRPGNWLRRTRHRQAVPGGTRVQPADMVGEHQREIEEAFSGRVRYLDSGPAIACPLVVMAFTNRSGSTLLGEYLRLTGDFAGFHEHLNGFAVKHMAEATRARSFPDHVAALADFRDEDAKVYGVKASWDQLLMLLRWRIDHMFASFHVIHVERLDVLAQAVSFSIADQTKQWMSTQAGSGSMATYSSADIRGRLDGIGRGNRMIREICSVHELDSLHTRYEDITSEPAAELKRIHEWLGIPIKRVDLGRGRLQRQRTQVNEAFICRFRAEAAEEVRQERFLAWA